MKQTFKVIDTQDKEWDGKKFVEANIQQIGASGEPEGETYKVSFWKGELNDSNGLIRPTIDGELSKNEKGYWKLSTAQQVAGANFKANQIEKGMERKEQGIAKAQDNKEYGIRTAATMSQSVQIALAEYANPNNLYTLDELISKWRKYLWEHWEDVDKFAPF